MRLPFDMFKGRYGGTEDERFNSRRVSSITLLQNLEDGGDHTLYIDDISIVDGKSNSDAAPDSSNETDVAGFDRHFDLAWQPIKGERLLSYRIYRSWDGKEFEPVGTRPAWSCRYEDFVGEPGKTAHYKISAIDVDQKESPLSEAAQASTRQLSDDELLDMVEQGCYRYYWECGERGLGHGGRSAAGR